LPGVNIKAGYTDNAVPYRKERKLQAFENKALKNMSRVKQKKTGDWGKHIYERENL
jgi:hypothetical protein